jgi:hypothetical protein
MHASINNDKGLILQYSCPKQGKHTETETIRGDVGQSNCQALSEEATGPDRGCSGRRYGGNTQRRVGVSLQTRYIGFIPRRGLRDHITIPPSKESFLRLKGSVLPDVVEPGTSIFSVSATSNTTESSTLKEYLGGWKDPSGKAGCTQYEDLELIVDEGKGPIIHGFMEFPSAKAMTDLFAAEEYKEHAQKFRPTAFSELKGVHLEI